VSNKGIRVGHVVTLAIAFLAAVPGSYAQTDPSIASSSSDDVAAAAATPFSVGLVIGVATPNADNLVSIDVTLTGHGSTNLAVALYVDDRFMRTIDCEINPALGLEPLGAAPENVTCLEDDSIGACKTLGVTLSDCGEEPLSESCSYFENPDLTILHTSLTGIGESANEIPPGRLYTCTFEIVRADPYERHDFEGGLGYAQAGDGSCLEVQIQPGAVFPGEIPTPTATPPPSAIVMSLESEPVGASQVAVSVVLDQGTAVVGGVQNDLIFDNRVLALEEQDCQVNHEVGNMPRGPDFVTCFDDSTIGPCKTLNKRLVRCSNTPDNGLCPPRAAAHTSVMRAIIAATAVPNDHSIPDGALYTCVFTILDPSRLPGLIKNTATVGSDPVGNRIDSIGIGTWIDRDLTSMPADVRLPSAGGGGNQGCQVEQSSEAAPAFLLLAIALWLTALSTNLRRT